MPYQEALVPYQEVALGFDLHVIYYIGIGIKSMKRNGINNYKYLIIIQKSRNILHGSALSSISIGKGGELPRETTKF